MLVFGTKQIIAKILGKNEAIEMTQFEIDIPGLGFEQGVCGMNSKSAFIIGACDPTAVSC